VQAREAQLAQEVAALGEDKAALEAELAAAREALAAAEARGDELQVLAAERAAEIEGLQGERPGGEGGGAPAVCWPQRR
jgi:hypothetical protein